MAKTKYTAKRNGFPGGVEVTFHTDEQDAPGIPGKYYYEGDEDFDKYKDGHAYSFGEEDAQPAPPTAVAPPEPAAKELAPTKRAARKGA